MKRLVWSFAFVFASVAGAAHAQETTVRFSDEADQIQTVAWEDAEINAVSWQSRVSQLEAELVSMREQMSNQSMIQSAGGCSSCGNGGCGGGCGASCGGCDPCYRNSGVYFGAEAAFLKLHHSSGTSGQGLASNTNLETDYEATPRIWLGYQHCDGLGFRLRYWEFDHDYGAVSALTPSQIDVMGVDTYTIDAEITDTTRLGCNWDATLSFGFRYVEFEEFRGLTGTGANPTFTGSTVDFSGYGLTLGGELRRAVTCNLNLYAGMRGSLLFGDNDQNFLINNVVQPLGSTHQENVLASILEIQIGAEYSRPIGCNANFIVRGGFEAQYWDSVSPGFVNAMLDNDGAFGLGGFTVAAGITR